MNTPFIDQTNSGKIARLEARVSELESRLAAITGDLLLVETDPEPTPAVGTPMPEAPIRKWDNRTGSWYVGDTPPDVPQDWNDKLKRFVPRADKQLSTNKPDDRGFAL